MTRSLHTAVIGAGSYLQIYRFQLCVVGIHSTMDLSGSDVSPPGESECDDAARRQLLVELQQLTKQQTSYTTVLQSLNQRQNVVNDRLLRPSTAELRGTD